jgi:hypothetical protein
LKIQKVSLNVIQTLNLSKTKSIKTRIEVINWTH